MAIYHLSVKVIGRSAGRSSTAAAAYRSGERIEDRRTGEEHDYTRRSGVEHSEIVAPAEAPGWALDRAELWNAVEAAEARKDAQLCREFEVALPSELSADARAELVREWVSDELVSKGMVADVAIHEPSRNGDDRNHHAHVLATMRPLEGDGFGAKAREWNSKDQLEGWRSSWEEYANRALARSGSEERIDHRSLDTQLDRALDRGDIQAAASLDREPGRHLGPAATAIERAGRELTREDLDGRRDGGALRQDREAAVPDAGGTGGRGPSGDGDRGTQGKAGDAGGLADAVERAIEAARSALALAAERIAEAAREVARTVVDRVSSVSTSAMETARAKVDAARARLQPKPEPPKPEPPKPEPPKATPAPKIGRDGPDRDDGGRGR